MPDGTPLIDPDAVAGRIGKLLYERRPGAVKPLLAALEKLAPDHRELALLRAAYYCQMQDFPQALRVLEEALARQPENPALHLRRAEILFGRGDYAGAAGNAAEAVVRAPHLTRAKSALGLALLGLWRFDLALPCLEESFAADPAGVDVALAFAALSPENAVDVLTRAVGASPHVAVLRSALIRRFLCADDLSQALHHIGQARADGVADAEIWCLQAFAQMQEASWDEAGISAARARSLAPSSRWAARLAAALACRRSGRLGLPLEEDALAAEQALYAGGTILPGSFRELLRDGQNPGPVLDLFCGTGLNAIAARDVCAGPWTGIEPDPALRKLCAGRGLYARLEGAGPLDYLATAAPSSVILLNEALGHVESPQSWFDALRAGLAADGMALAAIPTGRAGLIGHALFAHSPEHIARHAKEAGLAFSVERSGILRHVEGLPLHGVIARFRLG